MPAFQTGNIFLTNSPMETSVSENKQPLPN